MTERKKIWIEREREGVRQTERKTARETERGYKESLSINSAKQSLAYKDDIIQR